VRVCVYNLLKAGRYQSTHSGSLSSPSAYLYARFSRFSFKPYRVDDPSPPIYPADLYIYTDGGIAFRVFEPTNPSLIRFRRFISPLFLSIRKSIARSRFRIRESMNDSFVSHLPYAHPNWHIYWYINSLVKLGLTTIIKN